MTPCMRSPRPYHRTLGHYHLTNDTMMPGDHFVSYASSWMMMEDSHCSISASGLHPTQRKDYTKRMENVSINSDFESAQTRVNTM